MASSSDSNHPIDMINNILNSLEGCVRESKGGNPKTSSTKRLTSGNLNFLSPPLLSSGRNIIQSNSYRPWSTFVGSNPSYSNLNEGYHTHAASSSNIVGTVSGREGSVNSKRKRDAGGSGSV